MFGKARCRQVRHLAAAAFRVEPPTIAEVVQDRNRSWVGVSWRKKKKLLQTQHHMKGLSSFHRDLLNGSIELIHSRFFRNQFGSPGLHHRFLIFSFCVHG